VRVIRGAGMPVLQGRGRGDHRLLVNVTVPRRLTDEQRRMLDEFEQMTDEETYRPDDDEGFFDKLKSAFR
jgi:molecular chaperone DnaJ